MRTIYWLFLISVALFVSGIGFVIAGARVTRPDVPIDAPVMTPVASIKQVMNGIVAPAATVVFGAVGTIISIEGIQELKPQNDEEWEAVGNSAAALVESGNLLMMGSRAVDRGDWVTMSQALVDAAKVSLKAIEAKSPDDLLLSGEELNASCDNCHRKYQRQ